MKCALTYLVFTLCCVFTALAQDQPGKALRDAAKNAPSLTVSTVNSNVNIDAVLIPRVDARRIFGEEIARNYAVIEVNIGNKSPDSALLVQGVYIDYSRWAMSGFHGASESPGSRFGQYQTSNDPSHVASNEYRVVRGQLLDAQHSTRRNLVVDWLSFAVSLASGFDFAIHEQGIKTGFGKAGTIGIPGLKTAWPDATIDQLKTIDDYGFRSGKSIPRQGSDIIICFFPIDKFLTPGFKKLYLKAPALFFVPGLMLVDKTVQKDVERVLGQDLGVSGVAIPELKGKLPCFGVISTADPRKADLPARAFRPCLSDFGLAIKIESGKEVWQDDKPVFELKDAELFKKYFLPLAYLSQMTLNSITVTLDGVMTIDTSAFAAKVDTVVFDKIDGCGDDTSSCFWTDITKKDGVRTGTVSGSYMTGGAVVIDETGKLNINELKTVADQSNDQVLHFSFKLSQGIASGATLTFRANKTQSGPNATEPKILNGAPKEYMVNYDLKSAINQDRGITANYNANMEATSITIKGKNLSNPAKTDDLTISLTSPSNTNVPNVMPTTATATEIVVPIPADAQPVGCWSVTVKVGGKELAGKFEIAPTIKGAVISGTGADKKLTITGSFLNATDCQTSARGLQFQLEKSKQLIVLTPPSAQVTETKITIPLTDKSAAADPSWTLHIWFNGKEVTHPPMQ